MCGHGAQIVGSLLAVRCLARSDLGWVRGRVAWAERPVWLVKDILNHDIDDEADPKSVYFQSWVFLVKWGTLSGQYAGTTWENPLCPGSTLDKLQVFKQYVYDNKLEDPATKAAAIRRAGRK